VIGCGGHSASPVVVDANGGSGVTHVDGAILPGYQGFVNLQTATSGSDGPILYAYGTYFMPGTNDGVFCYTGSVYGTADLDCCLMNGTIAAPAQVSAGQLTLTNNTQGVSGTMDWNAGEDSYGELSTELVFTTGDSLTVTAAGDTAPAFTATTTFPKPIEGLVTPSPLSLAAGWTVTWTPAGATTMEVYLSSGVGETQLACRTADSVGKIVFPPALLAGVIEAGDSTVLVERKNIGVGSGNPASVLEPEVSATPSITIVP